MTIDGRTSLYGLVRADPSGSWSPAMHAAAFREQALNATYVPLCVTPERLSIALDGAHALGFLGLSVGAPHKMAAARACVELDEVAISSGAVNTMCRLAHGWSGYNTDALALRGLMAQAGASFKSVLIIGAGGAARATVAALRPLGARVLVAARRIEAAEELRHQVAAAKVEVEPMEWSRLPEAIADVECIVNAVPFDTEHAAGLSSHLRSEQFVVDWVYGGTSLTSAARRLGCKFVGGNALLVRQGALANKLWTGLEPPERSMALAVSEAAARAAT